LATAVLALAAVPGAGQSTKPAGRTLFLDNAAGVVSGAATYDPATRKCGAGTYLVYTDVHEAGRALTEGDTLLIRQGEYCSRLERRPSEWAMGSLAVGGRSNTVRNYGDEEVWIKGGPSRTTPADHPNNAVSISGEGNVLQGVHVYGGMILSGVSNRIERCDLSGGFDHQSSWDPGRADGAWPNVVRFIRSTGAVVRNCSLHDNVKPPRGGNNSNMSIIMHEEDVDTLIEHCHIYNTVKGFAYTKYQSTRGETHYTYRYNFFEGPNGGVELAARFRGKKQIWYQNIFINCPANFFGRGNEPRARISNNTFYNVHGPLNNWLTTDHHDFFNNVVCVPSGEQLCVGFEKANDLPNSVIDWNCYFLAPGAKGTWQWSGFSGGSLKAWQEFTAGKGWPKDRHSIMTDPQFVNASGKFNRPEDFKRKACPRDGRGGDYPDVMGAYITGDEVIGIIPQQVVVSSRAR
jgi:hypothetical protein